MPAGMVVPGQPKAGRELNRPYRRQRNDRTERSVIDDILARFEPARCMVKILLGDRGGLGRRAT